MNSPAQKDAFLRLLSLELDGMATAAQRSEIEASIQRDPLLAGTRDRFQAEAAARRSLGAVTIPAGLEQRVLAGVRARAARPAFAFSPLRAAAAVLILAAVSAAILQGRTAERAVYAAPTESIQAQESARAAWRELGVAEERIDAILALREKAAAEAARLQATLKDQALAEALQSLDARTAAETLGLLSEAERARFASANGFEGSLGTGERR